MRTKSTVLISRADMDASAQECDFDLKAKKFTLRTNVKVVLKNFDASLDPNKKGSTTSSSTPEAAPQPSTTPVSVSPPLAPRHPANNDSLLDSPGSYSNTNAAPIPPDNK